MAQTASVATRRASARCRLLELDARDGSTRASHRGAGLLGISPAGVVTHSEGRAWFFRADATSAAGPIALATAAGWSIRPSGPCGARDEDVVLPVKDAAGSAGLTRVSPDGAVRWTRSLDALGFGIYDMADGRMPRRLPVLVYRAPRAGEPEHNEVVIVDLDDGAVVGRHAVPLDLVTLVTGERAYARSMLEETILELDPTRGEPPPCTTSACFTSTPAEVMAWRAGPGG